jgi:hypothetical protein
MAQTRHLPCGDLRSIVASVAASTGSPAVVAGASVEASVATAEASVTAAEAAIATTVLGLSLSLGAANDGVSDCSS